MTELTIERDGVSLAAEVAGSGPAVILLHGLTATRRYVVMGSRALEREGHRVVSYDARGHGRSSAAADRSAYRYEDLRADLEAVLDRLEIERAVLAGSSMGAHTLLALALRAPERVAGMVVITPAYDPATQDDADRSGALGRPGGRPRLAEGSRGSWPPTGNRAYPSPCARPCSR